MIYFRSLLSVSVRLKPVWLLLFLFGLLAIVLILSLDAMLESAQKSFAAEIAIYVAGGIIGFACSSYFSREDRFLVRGGGDAVYLVLNRPLWPSVYELDDRVSLNALGGVWHNITHVSVRVATLLSQRLGRGKLSLKDALLYRPYDQKSVFAVVVEIRFGVPNVETQKRIWGENAEVKRVQAADLDQWSPGWDLQSVHYWPKQDRGVAGEEVREMTVSDDSLKETHPTSEDLRVEYEAAQKSAEHNDKLVWSVTNIMWAATLVLMGFILQAATKSQLRPLLTVLSVLGIVLSVSVWIFALQFNGLMKHRYNRCKEIEKVLGLRLHRTTPWKAGSQRLLYGLIMVLLIIAWITILWTTWSA